MINILPAVSNFEMNINSDQITTMRIYVTIMATSSYLTRKVHDYTCKQSLFACLQWPSFSLLSATFVYISTPAVCY